MPKILIKETDNTSAGTPGSYSNYSVLIVGFRGETREGGKVIIADSNEVYTFTEASDFATTIGLATPEREEEQDLAGLVKTFHYGNQMAYELLQLGYPIIYKVIESIDELTKQNFWDIFKDKANYDFRFITHGLLESTDTTEYPIYAAKQEEQKNKNARLALVKAAITALNTIKEEVVDSDGSEDDTEAAIAREASYSDLIQKQGAAESYPGLIPVGGDGTFYSSYSIAVTETAEEKETLEKAIEEIDDMLKKAIITTEEINEVNGIIANLATYVAENENSTDLPGRGDCLALIELDERCYVDSTSTIKPENLIIDAISKLTQINNLNGKFCAMTVPSVTYKTSSGNKKFPGAFHYLACFINSINSGFAEWYAAAGYTRGVSSYVIDSTSVKLGEIAINALEPRSLTANGPKFSCNVIANFRGSYYLWGNRTAAELKSAEGTDGDLKASHFLNIRHLCTTIKKQLYVACRRFTFDPNSDTLWFNFVNAIKPTLEAMKADQGIRDYKIIKLYTDKKATLKAKIRIIPIEAVEDFDLEISLEDSFGETTAIAVEVE